MKNNILKLSSFLFVAAVFSGCLKDKHYDDNEYQSLRYNENGQKVVSIGLRTDITENFSVLAFDATPTPTVIDLVPITLSGGFPAAQDVHVVVDTMNDLIRTHNADVLAADPLSTDTLVIADPTKYTILSKNITIPAGQSKAYVQVRVTLTDFIGATYGIGFKIVSADGGYILAGVDKDKGIAGLAIKNRYDGRYIGKGYGNLGGNTTAPFLFSWPCNEEIDLATSGASSVVMNYQPLFKNGALVYYSGINPKFTFDLATDAVTAVTPGATGNISVQYPVDASYHSRYDAATKTIYVKFGYNGNPAWIVVDTLTYCSPRP